MNRENVTVLTALDLSTALTQWIKCTTYHITKFGIHGTALDWFKNYLAPRNMKIIIGNTYSSEKDLTFSEPQGLYFGADLFDMYSGTVSKVIDSSLNLNGFANDHSIMKEFNPNLSVEESETVDLLINNLAKIKIWMNSVRLKMNDFKSELIIFCNNAQTYKCITSEINIEGQSVQRSHLVRYLSAWLDSDLAFKTYVKKKCTASITNLQRIKNIWKYLTTESCAKLVVSFCMLHLDYWNSIISGLLDCTVNQMQHIQNYGAKLVLGNTKYDSSTAALAELHWVPVRSHIKFKTLTLVFKCIKGDAPNYLKNLLIRCPETSWTLRSSNIKDHLIIP